MTLYLIYETFYTFVVLRPTFTSHERRDINVDDFPEIILCPEPSIDLQALNSLGYGGPNSYFKGNGLIGWGNNSEDIQNFAIAASTLKSVKDCEHVKSKFKFSKTVDKNVKFNLTAALLNPHQFVVKSSLQNIQNPIHCNNSDLIFHQMF